MRRFLSVLFWSVIAAAFIGPGTVATCAAAGASWRMALLWALLFSTLACLVLQEAAARVTRATGRDLGQALRARFDGTAGGPLVLLLVLGAIVLGCAAYQMGNLLGAAAGLALEVELPPPASVALPGIMAVCLLWFAATRTVARLLGLVVGVMGVAFLTTAVRLAPAPGELLSGLFVPSFPSGAGTVVIALIGTTVVPYNLFLGSGLARGQPLREIRFGLAVAVPLGGLISMAVLVVGSAVPDGMSFSGLAGALAESLGPWARRWFALGLFGAGFSSALTAPLAAAVTARSLFAREGDERWSDRSWRYRAVWGGVLLAGLGFAASGVKPIPAIVLAQALNGLILPFVAVFLLLVVNDRSLMTAGRTNGPWANAAMGATVAVTVLLGGFTVWRAVAAVLDGG